LTHASLFATQLKQETSMIHAYAAKKAGGVLKPFKYDVEFKTARESSINFQQ
jgi:hypothetical protein